MKEVIVTGLTVDEAIMNGCNELGEDREDVSIEIIDMPVKKTFGLFGGNPAKVRIYIDNSPVKAAQKYIEEIVTLMGVKNLDVKVTEEPEGDGAGFDLSGDNINMIIGKHGETMDAIQYLTGLVANKVNNSYYRITVNTGNYREKREKTLYTLAQKIANGAVRTGRNTSLEPMNPYERRIIHSAVQEIEGAKSWSIGEDMHRHVVIGPINKPAYTPRYQGGYNKNRQGQGGGGYKKPYNNNRPYNNNKPYNNNNKPYSKPYDKNRTYNNRGPVTENKLADSTPAEPAVKKQDGDFPLYGKIDR